MKEIDVRFGSGREVLNAYWGYLSDGGLVIDGSHGLDEGQPVSLNVHIATSGSEYLLAGKVVKTGRQVVIAFRPGEPHDMLLTEALAETDNVPARRHRRHRVDLDAKVRDLGNGAKVAPAKLVNVSRGGCCIRVDEGLRSEFGVGARVAVHADGLELLGEVVWSRHLERGVCFEALDTQLQDRLEAYLDAL